MSKGWSYPYRVIVDSLKKKSTIMKKDLSFKRGEQIVIEGEDFIVLGITNLGTEGVHLSTLRQWGTHILTLERSRDGKCYAATRYASGEIGLPYPFRISQVKAE